MKTTTKRSFSLLGSIVFLIAGLVIYANFIRTEYKRALDLRGQLAAKNQLLADQKKVIMQVQDLINQYKGTTQLQDMVSLALPSGEEVAPIFQQINAIAKGSGLITQAFGLNTLAFKPAATQQPFAKNLGTIQITLKLFGPYQGLKNFLQAIESNVRVMDLSEIRLDSAAKPGQDAYNFSVVLNTYYQQP